MDGHVGFQAPFPRKLAVAYLAFVGSLGRVGGHVFRQIALEREAFLADFAGEFLVRVMGHAVNPKTVSVIEYSLAYRTFVFFCYGMTGLVFFAAGLAEELSGAQLARIRFFFVGFAFTPFGAVFGS